MIDKIEIIEQGIFKKSSAGSFNEPDADSPTGYYIRTSNISLVEATSEIIATRGVLFGIKYVPVSANENSLAYFQCKIIHPPLASLESKAPFDVTIEDKCDVVNEENFDFYEFEHDWEMQEGVWRFQIIEKENLLYEHEFTVRR